MARRRGKRWFVAGINSGEKRQFVLPLDFVGRARFSARIFRDADPDDRRYNAPIQVETRSFAAGDRLTVTVAANGGFAVLIED